MSGRQTTSPVLRRHRAEALLGRLGSWPTTGIGSLPFADPAEAVAYAWSAYDVPFAPQIPALDPAEIVSWRTAGDGRCEWSPERDRARPTAWPELVRAIQAVPPPHGVVKLQMPGPCSLAYSMTTAGRCADDLAGLAAQLGVWLGARASAWIAELAELGAQALVTIDEPQLAACGITPAGAKRAWHRLALAGPAWAVHTCGPPPWHVLAGADADAWFIDVARYPLTGEGAEAVCRLVDRGGRIGLGVIPAVETPRLDAARQALKRALGALEQAGLDHSRAGRSAFLTPACGSGRVSPRAERAIGEMLAELQ